MRKYLIDANILIYLDDFTSIKYHPEFWDELKRQIKLGKIIILRSIYDECKNKRLKGWLKKINDEELITPIDEDIINTATALNRQYGVITKNSFGKEKSRADLDLLAYAKRNEVAILTRESFRYNPNQPMKIPDVCQELSIHCERLVYEVMKELGFRNCSFSNW